MTELLVAALAGVVLVVVATVAVQRPEWALAGLCLASPFGLFYVGPAQLVTVLAIAVIAVMVAARWSRSQTIFPANGLSWAALLWSAGVLLSVLFSPYWADAGLFAVWLVVSSLLAVAVTGIADSRSTLLPVLAAWLVSAVVVSALGQFIKPPTVATATASYGGAVISGRATSVFSQPNEFGTYCMLMFLVAVAVALRSRSWLRWLAVLTAATCGYGLIQSYSRGAWIGCVIGVAVILLVEPRSRRPALWAVGFAAVALAVVSAAAPSLPTVSLVGERLSTISDPAANPDDYRPALVAEGVRQFAASPWLGGGPNTYPLEGSTSRSLEPTVGGQHPHNVVLLVAAEQGLWGLLATAVIAGVVIVSAFPVLPVVARGLPGPAQPASDWAVGLVVGGVAGLSAVLTEGMVDAPLRNALMRSTVWLALGLTVAAALVARRPEVSADSPEPALTRSA